MTNPLTIKGFTVYHDDADEIQALQSGGPPSGDAPPRRFYVLPDKPAIAEDEQGNPIFSLIVYRRDEERIDPARSGEDVGGGILTFTVELKVPDETFEAIRRELRMKVFGDASDPDRDVDLSYVPFLEGKVSVAVAGEAGDGGAGNEFVRTMVGAGKVSGIGNNRKAVMVKLSQDGAALMSSIENLRTLPINVQYELSFEHRLQGVSMRVWLDMDSSYVLIQETLHQDKEFDDGYLGLSENHVSIDKVTHVTEILTRNKTAGVTVIPQTSEIDDETLVQLEKFGFDMLNKEMEKALQASPPPAELDRTYLESFVAIYGQSFNFSLDRRMVLVRNHTVSANVGNVFQGGNLAEMIAFVDLRIGFFTFLKVPIRVNADFSKLPVDSVTVTVIYERQRFDGSGREERVDSFNFTDGSTIQTFLAYANRLDDVTYDWSATVHYKGEHRNFTFNRKGVKDNFLVVDVGSLGMLQVDMGLGLVNIEKFPAARVSVRYRSQALGQMLEQSFLLNKEKQSVSWTEVIHETMSPEGYEYKVDWLNAGGEVVQGEWQRSTASRQRFDAPVLGSFEIAVTPSGNFKDGNDALSTIGVSLRYRDEENHYTEEGRLVFTDEKQQQTWTVEMLNPDLRDYEYRYSLIYKDGVVKEVPEDGGWLKGQPGFLTVGEKYTLEVELFPTLLTYPDHAKLVQVNLIYSDPANSVRSVDSFVFTKETSQPKTWRVRGVPGGPKTYTAEIAYFSAAGDVITVPPSVREAEVLVLPPPPAPVAPAPPPIT